MSDRRDGSYPGLMCNQADYIQVSYTGTLLQNIYTDSLSLFRLLRLFRLNRYDNDRACSI
jgi:hypothetical protein